MGRLKPMPMSMEEHRALATKMRQYEAAAFDLSNMLARTNLFTVAKLKPVTNAAGTGALASIKSDLENHAFKEHPDEASIHLYYGTQEDADEMQERGAN